MRRPKFDFDTDRRLVDDRIGLPGVLLLARADKLELGDAAPVVGIPGEPRVDPVVAPPREEGDALVRRVELCELLERELHADDDAPRRVRPRRRLCQVIILEERRLERARVRKITVVGAGQREADGACGLRRGRQAYEGEAAGHRAASLLVQLGLFIFPMSQTGV